MTAGKILLVDDEEDIRLVLSLALADHGYEVLTAENGRQGLALFRKEKPPIVITDIKMPDIDGVNLLKRIKSEDPDTEVIMITGHGDMEVAIESFQFQATDFVTKPINIEALEKSLDKVKAKIAAREKLRDYTSSLEGLIWSKAERLADLERVLTLTPARTGGEMIANFQGLFDDLPSPVVLIDKSWSLEAINRQVRDEYGSVVGRFCHQVFRGQELPCQRCPVRETLAHGTPGQGPTKILTADKRERDVLILTMPIIGPAGLVTHALVLYTEISGIMNVHDHLSSLGLMVGAVSHSIKGMLTGLDGGVYLLDSGLKKEDERKVREGLDLVKTMVGRIRNTVLDVLLFSKERDLNKQWTDVGEFARNLADFFRPGADAAGIEFRFRPGPELGRFRVDPAYLRTALINILDNALEAGQEDIRPGLRWIDFRVESTGEMVAFHVDDNGPGMDQATRLKVFDLFFSTKRHKGTGLGLYITKRTITQHGGRIEVQSTPGQGSGFEVWIPRTQSIEDGEKTGEEYDGQDSGHR